MIIRSFMDESVAAALKQVRTEMGGEAVVLKTRQVAGESGSTRFEVTACLDKPFAAQASRTLPDHVPTGGGDQSLVPAPQTRIVDTRQSPPTQTDQLADRIAALDEKVSRLLTVESLPGMSITTGLETISRAVSAMKGTDVPQSFINSFVVSLRADLKDSEITNGLVLERLAQEISAMLDPQTTFKPGDRVLMMGPVASGKTSALGKLAARLVLEEELPVKMMTLDSPKVGAIDEIESYAELLGVDTSFPTPLSTPPEDAGKVVLIDGCSLPIESDQLDTLKQEIDKLRPTHRLAFFSALTRSIDIHHQAEWLAKLSPTHIAFTMTDLSSCWGGLIAAVSSTNAKLAFMTNTPSGVSHLVTPDAVTISRKLLRLEEDHD